MNRRVFLNKGSLGAAGLIVSGCSTRAARPQAQPVVAPVAPARPMLMLPRPRVTWESIIRTTIGLRPFRPAGFVLKAEAFGEKTLVHNYGHGGTGWSLCWGTGTMAAEMALETGHRRAAVIGCGIVGIATARLLQKRGFETTIYTRTVPPDTTSNMALAGFTPTSGMNDVARQTPEWVAQFQRAVEISYRQWQLLVSPLMGVSWVDNYALTNEATSSRGANPVLPASVRAERERLGPGEHPFPTQYAFREAEMRFEPSICLDALLRDFLLFGGKVVIREFASPRALATLDERVVVNCTGLGSRDLFGDKEMIALKGQLIAIKPQSEIQYATNGALNVQQSSPQAFLHMMPRSDGLILGGTSLRDVWTLEPSEDDRRRVMDKHIELYAAMKG